MATSDYTRFVTKIAGVALTNYMYHFCIVDTDGEVNSGGTTLTAQGRVDGIVGEAVPVGMNFPMAIPDGGVAKVKCGDVVTAGQVLATAADGRAIPRGASNGNLGWGVAMEDGVADQIISMQFVNKGQINA